MHAFASLTALATTALAAAPTQVQLHPSAPNKGELSVDFVGAAPGAGSCKFGAAGAAATVPTTQFDFPNIGTMHQAVLDFGRLGLQAGDVAWYACSADGGRTYSANTSVTPITAAPPRAAIFGDFGIQNDVVMAALAADAGNEAFDYVLHVGDFAYDMEEQQSSVGNRFQETASISYAMSHPVSVSPGNHEACGGCPQIPGRPDSRGNFSEYRARFASVEAGAGKRSGSGSNIFYSFDLGLTHFISFSAEAYAYRSGAELLANQLAFMTADLAAVDRSVTPWVVALVHKDWNMEGEAYAAFYPILDAGKVDALFCGHIHYYNRNMPYDAVTKEIDTASVTGPKNDQTYTDPRYMVNIVTGASGDKEGETPCVVNVLPPSVTCTADYGYGVWTAVNASFARWEFQSIKPDYIGPANYTDVATFIKTKPVRA